MQVLKKDSFIFFFDATFCRNAASPAFFWIQSLLEACLCLNRHFLKGA